MITSNTARPAEIMILAGTKEDQSQLSFMLQSRGYQVLPVGSVEAALAALKNSQPDLLLMDTGCSDMSIKLLYRKIKENSPSTDIPVIFITQMNAWKASGLQPEEADYVIRPCREEDLLSKVQNRLKSWNRQKELDGLHNDLHMTQETLQTMLKSASDSVIFTDADWYITMINSMAGSMTGWPSDSAIGKQLHDVFRIKNEQSTKTAVFSMLEAEMKNMAELKNSAVLITKEGIERTITHSIAVIPGHGENPAGYVLLFRDVKDERLYLDEIEFLSYHDRLTGLYNRRFLEAELCRQDISGILPITLVMGDLNGLKITNDALGHIAGDELLRKTAAVLKKCFRQEDIISRYGGDEFVILLPGTTSKAAEVLVKKALDEIKESKLQLSISFGWDTKTDKRQSIARVLKNAEDNMYRRKFLESPSIHSFTINAIIKTLYEKNAREEAHSKRVSKLSSAIGEALGLLESEINNIRTAGLLHDIGKIAVSNEVLEKNGPLNAAEWEEIKSHPEKGYRILCCITEMADLAETVRQHHERWDGKGYPRGLKGEEITLAARIICVADSFDAMTSQRPYRNGMPVQEAREELRRNMGTQFDPEIVRAFLESELV